MDVAIIGGTGAEGFGLTLRLAQAGHHVTIGSRDADRAAAKAEEARGMIGATAVVAGAENADAAAAPVVIVTVPFGALRRSTVRSRPHSDPTRSFVTARAHS